MKTKKCPYAIVAGEDITHWYECTKYRRESQCAQCCAMCSYLNSPNCTEQCEEAKNGNF